MKYKSLLKFELKKYFKTTLYFTITWVVLLVFFLSFYDLIAQNVNSFAELYKTMPKELLESFGKGMESITSIYGYFGNQIVTYIALSGSLFVLFITAISLASEVENKKILFLLTKPLSRLSIYYSKFIAITLNMFISNVILFFTTVISIKLLTKVEDLNLGFFVVTYLSIFILELFFICLSELLGSKLSNGKVSGIASLVVITSYIFNILSDITKEAEFIKYLSPNYYAGLSIIKEDKILKPELLVLIILSILFVYIGGILFKKRDIN